MTQPHKTIEGWRNVPMTESERIKRLEDKVRELECTITEQAIRIGILEARPLVMPGPWTYTTPKPISPPLLRWEDTRTVTYPSWSSPYVPAGHIVTRTYRTDQCVEDLYI